MGSVSNFEHSFLTFKYLPLHKIFWTRTQVASVNIKFTSFNHENSKSKQNRQISIPLNIYLFMERRFHYVVVTSFELREICLPPLCWD